VPPQPNSPPDNVLGHARAKSTEQSELQEIFFIDRPALSKWQTNFLGILFVFPFFSPIPSLFFVSQKKKECFFPSQTPSPQSPFPMTEKKRKKRKRHKFFLGEGRGKGGEGKTYQRCAHRQHSTNQRMTKTRILAIDERGWGWAKRCVADKHTNAYQKSMRMGVKLAKTTPFWLHKTPPLVLSFGRTGVFLQGHLQEACISVLT